MPEMRERGGDAADVGIGGAHEVERFVVSVRERPVRLVAVGSALLRRRLRVKLGLDQDWISA